MKKRQSDGNDYLFKAIENGLYRRDRLPSLVTYVPLNKCLQDTGLLADSIAYSFTHTPEERAYDSTYHWNILSACICGDTSSYVSLIWKKPVNLSQIKVTIIDTDQLKLFPILQEAVCANLINIIYS